MPSTRARLSLWPDALTEALDPEEVKRLALLADRKDRKERQRYHEMVMEELVPKPTGRYGGNCDRCCRGRAMLKGGCRRVAVVIGCGREAMIANRQAKNALRRNAGPDVMPELNESELMGSAGSDDFQAALRAKKEAEARRQERKMASAEAKHATLAEKVRAHQEREAQTLAMFREMAKAHKLGPAPPPQ